MEPLQEGFVLRDRYRVEACVEAGASENLYRVRDQRFATDWAMRELDGSALEPSARAAACAAFTEEATRLAPLRHQGMAQIVDHFVEGDRAYVLTEWVEGRSWERLIADHGGRLPLEMVADLGSKLLDVIYFFHTGYDPVPIRVIGPRSVWVTADDEIKLYDYGLGMHFRPPSSAARVYGEAGFVAPEHLAGGPPDLAMDIYAAGAVLYLAVAGAPPTGSAAIPSDVPPSLARVITKAVHADPSQRHYDIGEFKHDLMAVAEGFAPDATPSAGAVASTEAPFVESGARKGAGGQMVGSNRSGGCAPVVLLLAILLALGGWML